PANGKFGCRDGLVGHCVRHHAGAIGNAVVAALASFGVKPKELALAPRISRLIRDARPEPAAEPCDHGRRYSRALRAGRADLRSPQPRLANGCSADGGCADSSTAFRIWLQGAPVLPQADRTGRTADRLARC